MNVTAMLQHQLVTWPVYPAIQSCLPTSAAVLLHLMTPLSTTLASAVVAAGTSSTSSHTLQD
jgi:hypothetical protein